MPGEGDKDPRRSRSSKSRIEADEAKPSKYWIGVLCPTLEDDLVKLHLKLDHGLVITEIFG